MRAEVTNIEIKGVQFIGNSTMLLSLSNDRAFIVPLDDFKEIASLTEDERNNFEVIDGENLSFLALDEIYSLNKLIGFT